MLFMDVANKSPNLLQLIGVAFVLVAVLDLTSSSRFCFSQKNKIFVLITDSLRHMIFRLRLLYAYFLDSKQIA